MLAYLIRRILYAVPILIGVNLLTFALFFVVNTPDDMARMQLGAKRVTAEAIDKWQEERGYDKPLLFNAKASGSKKLTATIFYEKSVRLFVFDFGASEDQRNIGAEISKRMWPSLALAVPVFLVGLAVCITFALVRAFFGIPGLGSYTIDAIQAQDFAIVRSMVFIGSVLYIVGLILTDVSYTLVDPRIRLE